MNENPELVLDSCQAGIAFEILINFFEERLKEAEAQNLRRHLEQGCLSCAQRLRLLQRIFQAFSLEKQFRPPTSLAAQLQVAFRNRYKPPSLLPRLVAALTFDSRANLVPSLRGGEAGSFYQLLYQVGNYELDLQVLPSSEPAEPITKFSLLGQILPIDETTAKAEVSLLEAGGHTYLTTLSDQGEIEFMDLAGGEYQLEVKLADKMLIVEKIGLGGQLP